MNYPINGFCDENYSSLRAAFEKNFEEDLELGASFAVCKDGKELVDLWGGFKDLKKTSPWQKNTIVTVMSNTKIATLICVLILVDRGRLDLDETVAHYWPEFGQRGKEVITLRQVLCHRAGVPGFDRFVNRETFEDWDLLMREIESIEPWFEPGTVTCYHGLNFGFILGELVRLVSGKGILEFFREEVAERIDADFQIALSDPEDHKRVAEYLWAGELEFPPGSIPDKIFNRHEQGASGIIEDTTVVPAGSGHGNARSLAKIGQVLASGGEVLGQRILSREIVDKVVEEQSYDEDLVLGVVRYGLGVGLHSKEFPAITPTSFHWGGTGGSWLAMDLNSGISAAYAMNRMIVWEKEALMDERQTRFWDALAPFFGC